MTVNSRPHYRPSLTLVATLVLGAIYLFLYLPLGELTRKEDRPLLALWDQLNGAVRASDACAGLDLDLDTIPLRLAQLQKSEKGFESAERLVRSRTELPGEVRALMRQPFQLVDFQNERQRDAEALVHLGAEAGVALDPGATNGLPEYSVDMVEPGVLWARLYASHQLLLAALQCKVTTVKALTQLPPVIHRGISDGAPFLLEIPMRLELAGSLESVRTFLACLPVPPAELAAVHLPPALTNKPVLFLDRILLRKRAPEKPDETPKPGDVLLDVAVTSFVRLTDGAAAVPPP